MNIENINEENLNVFADFNIKYLYIEVGEITDKGEIILYYRSDSMETSIEKIKKKLEVIQYHKKKEKS